MKSISVKKFKESAEKRQPIEIDGKAYFVITDKDYLLIKIKCPEILNNHDE